MSVLAALALLAVQAGEPDADAPKPPIGSSAPPPTIDSLLDQPPMDEDARQAAVQAAYAAAQARRGGLDGRWRLTGADGQPLYIFQFTDPGPSPDPRSSSPSVPVIEGAWRDPSRPGAAGSGFLDSVQRDGEDLVVRFHDQDRAQVVTLHPRGGGWSGGIEGEAASRPVAMSRY